ncbi:MAG TPA: sialate O-acetylesterase [Pirellulales bacterium]|nr:sialate O-acetylesterase [Pirellulales bacterium]
MRTPFVCWGRFAPLIAVGLLLGAGFIAVDAVCGRIVADYAEPMHPNVNWDLIGENVAGRLAELETLEAKGAVSPDQVAIIIGQSNVREGFDPAALTSNDPLARHWAVLGSSGLDMHDFGATCLPLADSQVRAKTVVVVFGSWMIGTGETIRHRPASIQETIGDFKHLRLKQAISDVINQFTLVRYRVELGFLRKFQMFKIRLALSRYFGWPLTGTFDPRDPWTSSADDESNDDETQFLRYIAAAEQFRQVHFEDCAPQVEVLRGAIDGLRARGSEVVVLLAPERTVLRDLRSPAVDVELGRILSKLAGSAPLRVIDFRRLLPDDQFNTNSHANADGRKTLSRLLPELLAASDGSSTPAPIPADYRIPQFRLTEPLAQQVIQQSAGETTVAVQGQSVDALASAQVRWRRTGDAEFSPWQEMEIVEGRDCRARVILPGPGWYDAQIRALAGTDRTEMIDQARFGVGEVFIAAGGGSAANLGATRHQAIDDVVAWRGATWAVAHDPQLMASEIGGSPWPMFGRQISEKLHVPVAIVSVAEAGSNVADWARGTPLFDRLRRALAATGENCARAILWTPEPSAATGKTVQSESTSQFDSILSSLEAETGCAPPCLVMDALRESPKTEAAPTPSADRTGRHTFIYPHASPSNAGDADEVVANRWFQAVDSSGILPSPTP